MQRRNGDLTFSASDLNNFLECPHLTYLDLERAHGRLERKPVRTAAGDLVARKGQEHEQRHLGHLKSGGHAVIEIPDARDLDEVAEHARRTEEAMRAGAPFVYQATFLRDGWRGHADFLERVDGHPSALGDHSYEVADTKLARTAKPYFLLQLCFYSELVAAVQGATPRRMHVILGTGERQSYPVGDFAAYYRRVRDRFLGQLQDGLDGTYPLPCWHCGICRWMELCDERRVADDHLSLVARMQRGQAIRLNGRDIHTVAELATAPEAARPSRMAETTFANLRDQAALQVEQRTGGEPVYRLLDPEPRRGLQLLPEPDPGDVFFDMEGDPFYDGGLEYLFGAVFLQDGEWAFKGFWARDRAGEKRAFEQFMDFVAARRAQRPGMHVYHYAPYEPSALKRLMGQHGTREDEVDDLLRNHVLVDLYRAVAQGLRIGFPSYGLKKVEAFYTGRRDEEITDGEDSIVQFERFLESGDEQILAEIGEYNERDCRSTRELRDWLLDRRAEAEAEFGEPLAWHTGHEEDEGAEDRELPAELAAREELKGRLFAGLPEDLAAAGPEQRARWLCAQLLDYHRREAKPAWWEYFDRLGKTEEELIERDAEAIGGLEPDPTLPPRPEKQSLVYTLRFPPQEHRLAAGARVKDPATEQGVTLVRVDDEAGLVEIKRGAGRAAEPLPRALIPGGPYDTREQRAAVGRVAAALEAGGPAGPGPFRAARGILARELPRVRGFDLGAPLQGDGPGIDEIAAVASGLKQSCLFIQGPPGSGKTWTGAQIVAALLRQGKRVGVAAQSHKAIHNLLRELERAAAASGGQLDFRGLKKATARNEDSLYESELEQPYIENETSADAFPPAGEVQLVAGTAWLFAREALDEALDYLVIDEAGQVSVADALALGTSARNLILLGDPLQLAQVSQAVHPRGPGEGMDSAASALEHLLGAEATVPRERGLFLEHTRRMHPDVCRFVSEVVYEGRLESLAELKHQRVDSAGLSGTGVRWIAVEHEGNSRSSEEEAAAIATAVGELLAGGRWTNAEDVTVPLPPDEVMVVTPYNAQVRCLGEHLPDGVRIGTVDKFQGQEAAVVFFSMATSSGAEIPRNLEFLFSRNRLNVAISRARCLAVLVASPELLEVRCRSVEQMRLVSGLCRLVEVAGW